MLVEYTTIFLIFWVAVWFWFCGVRWKLLYIALGMLPAILVLMLYDQSLFGDAFTTPYAHLISEFDSVHGVGFFGATFPRPEILYELLLGTERGIVWYMPILILAFAGLLNQIIRRKAHQKPASIILATTLTYLLFYSAYSNWRGGSAFGPRYLIGFVPLLCIGIAFALESFSPRVVYAVGLISVFINWTGAQFGFAQSPTEHVFELFAQGPSLPVFGAILSHSAVQSTLYVLVLQYHAAITVLLSFVLALPLIWLWRRSTVVIVGEA